MPTYHAQAPEPPAQGTADRGQGAGEQPLDPSGQKPHGYFRECFFGTLAPISKTVEYSGHVHQCELRILEADEQRWCSQWAYERSQGHPEAEAYLQCRTLALIAKTLVSSDGKRIDDECKNLDHRLQLAAELPDNLQEALIAAYDEARYEPIAYVHEMAQQPNFAPTPTESGASSAGVPSPQEA